MFPGKDPLVPRKPRNMKAGCGRSLAETPQREIFKKRDYIMYGWPCIRKRRKTDPHEKECTRIYGSIEEGLFKSKELMERMLRGIISTLGPDEFEAIVERAKIKCGRMPSRPK